MSDKLCSDCKKKIDKGYIECLECGAVTCDKCYREDLKPDNNLCEHLLDMHKELHIKNIKLWYRKDTLEGITIKNVGETYGQENV